MSVESSQSAQGRTNSTAASHRSTAKSTQADGLSGPAAAGFSALLSLLSATEPVTDSESDGTGGPQILLASADPTRPDLLPTGEQNQPVALINSSLTAINFVSEGAPPLADISGPGVDTRSDLTGLNPLSTDSMMQPLALPTASVTATTSPAQPIASTVQFLALPAASVTVTTSPAQPIGNASSLSSAPAPIPQAGTSATVPLLPPEALPAARSEPRQPGAGAAKTVADSAWGLASVLAGADSLGRVSQVPTEAPLPHKAVSLPTHLAAQLALGRESGAALPRPELLTAVVADTPLALINQLADSMAPAGERGPGRAFATRQGGTADASWGAGSGVQMRADAPYQIEATAAAVPPEALAETVSFWATQGVQNAELTLDGFGEEPIEVRISMDGDLAQIDFRTNQPALRELLEAASAPLRDLLSGQGLQLGGVSVGASPGRGTGTGTGQQDRPTARQVTLQAQPVSGVVASRSLNPAVGQSLDLFV